MEPATDQAAAHICAKHGCTDLEFCDGGAFKRVYRVVSPEGRVLALKLIRSDGETDRMPREIDAMERCDHPNIGKLLTVGTHSHCGSSFIYLIEDFLAGGNLSTRLTIGRPSAGDFETLCCGLVSALVHLHELGIVHRDIKPANIMFENASWNPKMVDFGLVRDLNESSLTATWLPMGPGTPYYAAPEQLLNEKALIDWRTDQFALGVTLSISLLDRHPFGYPREAFGALTTVQRVAAREQQHPEFIQAARDAGVSFLCRMTKPWPVERFRRPRDLLARIKER